MCAATSFESFWLCTLLSNAFCLFQYNFVYFTTTIRNCHFSYNSSPLLYMGTIINIFLWYGASSSVSFLWLNVYLSSPDFKFSTLDNFSFFNYVIANSTPFIIVFCLIYMILQFLFLAPFACNFISHMAFHMYYDCWSCQKISFSMH